MTRLASCIPSSGPTEGGADGAEGQEEHKFWQLLIVELAVGNAGLQVWQDTRSETEAVQDEPVEVRMHRRFWSCDLSGLPASLWLEHVVMITADVADSQGRHSEAIWSQIGNKNVVAGVARAVSGQQGTEA